MRVKWAYGVTTVSPNLQPTSATIRHQFVPKDRPGLLDRTLKSMALAGFDSPRIFMDGATHLEAAALEDKLGLAVTARNPPLRTWGNWWASMLELYCRDPLPEHLKRGPVVVLETQDGAA